MYKKYNYVLKYSEFLPLRIQQLPSTIKSLTMIGHDNKEPNHDWTGRVSPEIRGWPLCSHVTYAYKEPNPAPHFRVGQRISRVVARPELLDRSNQERCVALRSLSTENGCAELSAESRSPEKERAHRRHFKIELCWKLSQNRNRFRSRD
ncbi:uncharacterized protein LOC130915871 isoform X2 [Corythoichthys intestinalis]|uniref:uncharacterized protein LOC130915871 isoform X2 n=1 Tax=Corythoichthys intestinalis TaxID=161448 RepID=UPI0025A5E2BE|nr:uncharacterized protein LOC130915871 isoform X2 [Corythoichthys intestinalis]